MEIEVEEQEAETQGANQRVEVEEQLKSVPRKEDRKKGGRGSQGRDAEDDRGRLAARGDDVPSGKASDHDKGMRKVVTNPLDSKKALCAHVARSRTARGIRGGPEAKLTFVDVMKHTSMRETANVLLPEEFGRCRNYTGLSQESKNG